MDSQTQVTVVTIVAVASAIVLGTIVPGWVEGRAVTKALEGMTRQPEAADRLRATLFISMAILETGAIYVLLICLILLFANPLLTRFF